MNRLEKGPAFGAAGRSRGLAGRLADLPARRHPLGGLERQGGHFGFTAVGNQTYRRAASLRSSPPARSLSRISTRTNSARFSAQTGKPLWKFSAGSRIDSPPAYADGFVYFGSRDGAVYSLRAADGALAWRFTPLPSRVICAYGELESAWPVDGTVLLKDGLVYFAAGRNSFLDGGIFVYALDMKTGEVRHQRRMYGPFGEDGFPMLTASGFTAAMGIGFKADVPVNGGACVYFKQQAFQPDLTPVKQTEVKSRHLIPNPGFLESIPQHRTFWTLDTMTRYDIPTGLAGVHGAIMVVDGDRFIEVRGYTPSRQTPFDPRVSGYALYCGIAGEKEPALAGAKDGNAPEGETRRQEAGHRRQEEGKHHGPSSSGRDTVEKSLGKSPSPSLAKPSPCPKTWFLSPAPRSFSPRVTSPRRMREEWAACSGWQTQRPERNSQSTRCLRPRPGTVWPWPTARSISRSPTAGYCASRESEELVRREMTNALSVA